MALGQLVGVVVVESRTDAAFSTTDEALLTVVASVVANAIELERSRNTAAEAAAAAPAESPSPVADEATPTTHVRFFPIDGSTFLDGDYLIKGVAGRLLWSLLGDYQCDGRSEFTNREVRLDP